MLRCLAALGSVAACAVFVSAAASTPAAGESAGLIAFSRAGSIYTVASDGSGLRQLAKGSSRDSDRAFFDPSWSPTGDRIVYLKGGRGTIMELWMLRADGSMARELPVDAEYISSPVTWSPNGKNLSFSRLVNSDSGPATYWIFRARLDGRGEKALTRPRGEIWDVSPAWSPRGDVIAFARYKQFEPARTAIHLVRADGRGSLSRVTLGNEPDWSRDGASLTFVRGDDVYAIKRDRSGLRRITRTTGKETSPEWGPEGTSIAFVRDSALWIIDADGSNERQVVGPADEAIDWRQRPLP